LPIVRNGTAVRPDWNQNGNIEFFVVPEKSAIVVIEGRAASYQLFSPPKRFFQLAIEEHAQMGRALPSGLGSEVTNQWLPGGDNQIFVIANNRNQRRPIFIPYASCIAIIETGFDVEL
jgi:hypothetical protein